MITSPVGVFDILPHDPKVSWRSIHVWEYVESIFRLHAQAYGFEEIRTPIFEQVELFCRSVGNETDVVAKEMYTFEDRSHRKMALRPEGTASVMRAFIEHKLVNQGAVHRFFYSGPMFRYERPQAGRYRQLHQFGVEAIGIGTPEQDAEIIEMLFSLYQKLGLEDLTVYVNSLGGKDTRKEYRQRLVDFLEPKKEMLSEDSRRRLELNPLRILDSKAPQDKEALLGAPSILECLTEEDKVHFHRVLAILDMCGVPYTIASNLVRGLDYYNKTVFEVTSGALGAQNTIGAGGRYDGLIHSLGGPDLPSIGYATGIERIVQTLLEQKKYSENPDSVLLYVIPLGESARKEMTRFIQSLRNENIPCLIDTTGKKLKQMMQRADAEKAHYVAVIGDTEVASGRCQLKEMATGVEKEASFEEIRQILQDKANKIRIQ